MNPIAGMSPWDNLQSSPSLNRDPKTAAESLGAAQANSAANESKGGSDELQKAFQDFVGQTLFGSMLASMRKTQDKPAYMHGGRAEEVFQQQLDQHIVDDITNASAGSISDPMFELFNLQRRAS